MLFACVVLALPMNLARYLKTCLWWNGCRVWVTAPASPLARLFGQIVRVAPAQMTAADVELTVLLEGGAVINVRASERGKLWEFD